MHVWMVDPIAISSAWEGPGAWLKEITMDGVVIASADIGKCKDPLSKAAVVQGLKFKCL